MKKMVAVLALAVAAAGLSGCASGSAEDRAEETATGYIQAYVGIGEKTVDDFLCEGATSTTYDPQPQSKVTVEEVVKSGDNWLVVGTFSTTTSVTPAFTVYTPADGSCVEKMENSRP